VAFGSRVIKKHDYLEGQGTEGKHLEESPKGKKSLHYSKTGPASSWHGRGGA